MYSYGYLQPRGTESRMRSGEAAKWFLISVLSVVLSLPLAAQSSYGTIVGLVTDGTGAIVPSASVTLLNVGTNVSETTTTNETGAYTFVNLLPGAYSVNIEATGFSKFKQENVVVQVGGTTRADASLKVGSVESTVTVSESPATLQTETANLGGVVEGQQIDDAPLNGRNVTNLLTFIPGVVAGGAAMGNTVSNQGNGQTQAIAYGNYQVGGGFSGQSIFFVDGSPTNVSENNVNALIPTQDAVQEFRVSTNNISAEFGGYGGGVIEMSTKSGTNSFHGSAYEYVRNTIFNANNYFSNLHHLGRTPLKQNQFGANLGGPIVKDKLFFFFSWERQSVISANVATYSLPTQAELGGDFTAPGINKIYDLYTAGHPQFQCNGVLNVICPNRLDQSAVAIVKTEVAAITGEVNPTNDFTALAPSSGYQNQYNARADYTLSPSDTVFARYTFWNPNNAPSDPQHTKSGLGPTGNTTTQAVLGDTHLFKDNMVGDLRLSFLRNYNFQTPLANGYSMSNFGSAYGVIQSEVGQGLYPQISIPGYSGFASDSQLYWTNDIFSLNGSLTKIVGRHAIKVGGLFRRAEWITGTNNQGVRTTSNASFTASGAGTGDALASFLLGIPQTNQIQQVRGFHAYLPNYAFYVTDTMHVGKRLTVDLGLRWEQPGTFNEKDGRDTVLLLNAPNSLGTIFNPALNENQTLLASLAYARSSQWPSKYEEALHWNLFSPRVGLAYRLNDLTVLRAGYGLSWLPAALTQDGPASSPINSATTSLTNVAGQTPVFTVSNPFPGGILLPATQLTQAYLGTLAGQTITARVPHQPMGYAQQWNAAVERAFGGSNKLSVAYAGSKGTHLTLGSGGTSSSFNWNQLPDQYDSMGSGLLTLVQNPFYGKILTGNLSPQMIQTGLLLRAYPEYLNVNQFVPRVGASTYNALQVAFNRRMSKGVSVGVAYTWSKLLGNVDNTSAFLDGQSGGVQDYFNLKAEKSISLQNFPNNLVVNYAIDLPFGRGRAHFNGASRLSDAFIGGWQLSGITTFISGTPVTFRANANNLSSLFGSGSVRPNFATGCNPVLTTPATSRLNEWFNTACYTNPSAFAFGNEPRVDPRVRTSPTKNFDVSLSKQFTITEQTRLQFIVQAFNIFNRVQFGSPAASLASPATIGQVTTQANQPRTFQFALRFSF